MSWGKGIKVLTRCYRTREHCQLERAECNKKTDINHTFSRPNFFTSADDGGGKEVEGPAAFAAARSSCSWALKDIHFDLAITLRVTMGEMKTGMVSLSTRDVQDQVNIGPI